MLDLEFIALELVAWPESATTVRLDDDGEICFDDSEHDFYADDLIAAHAVFSPCDRCRQRGNEYTREQWEQQRESHND